MELAIKQKQELINTWRWKTKDDIYIHPNDMETRHLFYVLRMIWNHFMPEELKIQPYNKYRFSSFYNNDYLKTAIIACGKALEFRDDLTARMKSELDFMAENFKKQYPALEVQ